MKAGEIYIVSCRGKDAKHHVSTYYLQAQNKDVHCNPRNPVNPDSELIFTVIVTLKTYQQIEDACIAITI
jgi:hypothetical protein